MAIIETFPIACDFTLSMVEDGCGRLGVLPENVTVYCPLEYAATAQEVRDRYRCQVVLLPKEILSGRDAWALGAGNYFIWSPGA